MHNVSKLCLGLVLLAGTACSGSITQADPAPSFEAEPLAAEVVEAPVPEPVPLPEPAPEPSGELISLHVWSQDASLRALATLAAERIRLASGVVVAVAPEPLSPDAKELRWTADYVEHFSGRYWMGDLVLGINVPEEARVGILVHELLHALGAEHVAQGAGILQPANDGLALITTADLESLCVEAACEWMTPEQ